VNIVEIRLTVPSADFELGQILTTTKHIRIQLARLIPTGDTFVPYFWAETDDYESFEASVRRDDRVATLDRLELYQEKSLYKIEWTNTTDRFIDALTAHDLVIDSAVSGPEEWQFRLRGPDHENFSAFQETLRAAGISSTVDRVWHPLKSDDDTYGLTAKQEEAVRLAFTHGYFNVPSETNLTKLAAQVDITRQSFSRCLTRGLHQIIHTTVMKDP
jgi:predicted DNA binding protein